MEIKGTVYNAIMFMWEYRKVSKTCVKMIGTSSVAALRQEWIFTIENGGVTVEMEIMATEGVCLEEFQMIFMVHERYKKWVCDQEDGVCPPIQSDQYWERVPFMQAEMTDFLSLIPCENELSAIVFLPKNEQKEKKTRMMLFNMPKEKNARTVKVVLNKVASRLKINMHCAFSALKDLEVRRNTLLDERIIRSKNVTLSHTGKGMKLYVSQEEITQAMGLYLSYYVPGTGWNDSVHHAEVMSKKTTQKEMLVYVKWNVLPMEQEWSFSFVDEDTLLWEIVNTVTKDFSFTKEQCNVMVSPLYRYWTLGEAEGTFPETFNKDYGGDWQCQTASSDVRQCLAVRTDEKKNSLPEVSVFFAPAEKKYQNKIINSDDIICGRVLQCFQGGNGVMKKGTYVYGKTCITIKRKD